MIPNQLANALLESWNKPTNWQGQTLQIVGEAKGEFTIKMVDASGKTILTQVQRGVPVKLWPKTTPPSSQGKSTTRKGN